MEKGGVGGEGKEGGRERGLIAFLGSQATDRKAYGKIGENES